MAFHNKKDTDIEDQQKRKAEFAVNRALFLTKCKTEKELNNWIRYFLEMDIPNCKVSRYADSTPADMIWEIYKLAILKDNPEQMKDLLYCSSRNSGKTLGLAIAEFLAMFHDQRECAHVGAILAQAAACKGYIQNFLMMPKVKDLFVRATKRETEGEVVEYSKDSPIIILQDNESRMVFNLNGKLIKMDILPCTTKSLNSKHPSFCSLDEIDTLEPEGVKALKELSGMGTSKDGKPYFRVNISTRKTRYGLMNKMMEEAEKRGRSVRKWTIWEFTERCPDERSGLELTPGYVKQNDLLCITEKEYTALSEDKQKGFQKYMLYDGCMCNKYFKDRPCPAAAVCLGDAKKQICKSPMLKPIDETIQRMISEDADWALSQLMNLKPSLEGVIYREFDETIHIKDWGQMWKTLTHTDFPGECTHDIFVKKCKEMKLNAYGGVDFGWTNPSAVVICYVDDDENIYIVRTDHMTGTNDVSWIHYIKTRYHHMYNVQSYWPDMASPSTVDLMKSVLPVATFTKTDINYGIQIVKKFLRVPGSMDSKVHIAKETNEFLIDELTKYHYKTDSSGSIIDIPEKEFDHCFTEGHQILTSDGWIDFKDLTNEHKVASIDDNKMISFEVPMKIIKNPYLGPVLNFKHGQYHSFEVTPNHDIVFINQTNHKKNKTNKFQKCKADSVPFGEIYIPKSAVVNRKTEYKQPFPDLGLSDIEWAYLLGMFLAEGCVNIVTEKRRPGYKHYRVHWDQKKPNVLKKLFMIFDKIKLNGECYQKWINRHSGGTTFELQKRKYYEYFKQFGKCQDKYIPRDILKLADLETLQALLVGLMDGDGSIMGSNNDYTTTSFELAQDFCELACLCGYSVHIKGPYSSKNKKYKDYYKIRIDKRKNYPTIHFKKERIIEKHYVGMVYCVSVSTGMIMVRNGINGSNFISGNSLDAFRYTMTGLFGNTRPNLGDDMKGLGGPCDIIDVKTGSYTRVPTAAEYAEVNGIAFNVNREEDIRRGDLVTLKELNDEDDDGEIGGSGGFLFSF